MESAFRLYLLLQAGTPLLHVEARDESSALDRAKGLGGTMELDPSLPLEAVELAEPRSGLPVFLNAYFEMMGFTS